MKSILWFVFMREKKKKSMILAGVLKFKKMQKRRLKTFCFGGIQNLASQILVECYYELSCESTLCMGEM